MKIKKKNLRRLASLSAVGAGAAFVTADRAEASSIVYSGPLVGATVGWYGSSGFHQSFTQFFSSNRQHGFKVFATGTSLGNGSNRAIRAGGIGSLYFAQDLSQLFPAGAVFSMKTSSGSLLKVNRRVWTVSGFVATTGGSVTNRGNFSNEYALFRFNPGSGPLYGWIELSGSVTKAAGPNSSYGPLVTVQGWAYDTTGAPIPAGYVPEPDTFALTGLAALAFGAAGMRRWRAARAAQ